MSAAKSKPSKSSPSAAGGRSKPSADEPPSSSVSLPPTSPLPERKHPLFLAASSVLLAAWLIFLAAMAYLVMQGESRP